MVVMAKLGDLERVVLDCLWNANAPMTVREVHEVLAENRQIAYTTVLTTLQRMARKGLLHQETEQRAHRYSALATRGEMFAELLADALGVAGNEPGVLVRFVDNLGSAERAALRAALDRESKSSSERDS
jgi:predicted transcriptional regulator